MQPQKLYLLALATSDCVRYCAFDGVKLQSLLAIALRSDHVKRHLVSAQL